MEDKIIIKSNSELLVFIERNDISYSEACKVVTRYLTTSVYGISNKRELVDSLKTHLESEVPIFLKQQGEQFSIKDLYKTDKNER